MTLLILLGILLCFRPPLRNTESMPSIFVRRGSETPKCLNSLVLLHSEDGRLGWRLCLEYYLREFIVYFISKSGAI